jgi:hypothetical protein
LHQFARQKEEAEAGMFFFFFYALFITIPAWYELQNPNIDINLNPKILVFLGMVSACNNDKRICEMQRFGDVVVAKRWSLSLNANIHVQRAKISCFKIKVHCNVCGNT